MKTNTKIQSDFNLNQICFYEKLFLKATNFVIKWLDIILTSHFRHSSALIPFIEEDDNQLTTRFLRSVWSSTSDHSISRCNKTSKALRSVSLGFYLFRNETLICITDAQSTKSTLNITEASAHSAFILSRMMIMIISRLSANKWETFVRKWNDAQSV